MRLTVAFIFAVMFCTTLACVSFAVDEGVDFEHGNGLLTICTDDKSQLNLGICLGYIDGVLKGAQLMGENSTHTVAEHWCVPEEVTMGQLKDVVVKSLREHPESRHQPSYILIANAVLHVWPCPK